MLDYSKLGLHKFYGGADVFVDGSLHRVSDPFRHAADALRLGSLLNPVGSFLDKVKVVMMRANCLSKSGDELLSEPDETTTLEYL